MRTFGELTPAEVSAVCKYYQEGNGYVACGLRYDISQRTIRKCLEARGIEPRYEGRMRSRPCMLPYIETKMRETGLTYAEISETICYEPQYVQGALTATCRTISVNLIRALADAYGWDYETMMRERDEYFGHRKRKTPNTRKYSEDVERRIVEAYKGGAKTAALAAAHGCSPQTIRSILHRAGLKVRRRKKSEQEYLSRFVSPSLAEWFAQSGMTFERLAPFVGLRRRTLIDRLVACNNTLRMTDKLVKSLSIASKIDAETIRRETDAWWAANRGEDWKNGKAETL